MDSNGYVFQVEKLIGYKADGTPVFYVEITGPAKGDGTDNRPKKPSKGEGVFCAVSLLVEDDGKVYAWDLSAGDWAEWLSLAST